MLKVHAFLVGHGGDADFEPGGIAKAGCDNGKLHRAMFTNKNRNYEG
jgi:hypothetical protein